MNQETDHNVAFFIAWIVALVALILALVTTLGNPCLLNGHIPMNTPEFRCQAPMTGVSIQMCAFEVRVCRRCKLLYLERVEVEEGRKQ